MIVNFLKESSSPDARILQQPQISLDRIGVIVLGGGEGTRLYPLTKYRCKPAIPFGGRYTLIDVPISHSLYTGLKKISVIGQYLATSLQKHLFQTYVNGISQNQIQMLVPEEREGQKVWYKGTADAVRQNLKYFAEMAVDYFLILSGDQLYNINFQEMINFGLETEADMVIAAQPVNAKDAARMGLLRIEQGGSRLIDFHEKPKEKHILEQYYTDDVTLHRLGYDPQNERRYLGSMGIYLFKKQALFELLKEDLREDFGKHLIQTQMHKNKTHVYLYDGYWEDIGTVESYYHANLALTRADDDRKNGFQCYDEKNLVLTKTYNLPGAKIANTLIHKSILCEGSIIEAKEINHSVIGVRSVIKSGTVIRDSLLCGNEYYEPPVLDRTSEAYRPEIGSNCLISRTIVDENVSIGDNVVLINKGHLKNYDSPPGAPELYVRDGIIIVPRGTHLPDGFTF